jgi:hypothetical protein
MAQPVAHVIDNKLQHTDFPPIVVGSAEWWAWLREASRFRYTHNGVTITARKEHVGDVGELNRCKPPRFTKVAASQPTITAKICVPIGAISALLVVATQPEALHRIEGASDDKALDIANVREALKAIETRLRSKKRVATRDARQLLVIAHALVAALQDERELTARERSDMQRYLHEVRADVQQAPPKVRWSRGSTGEVF